jgi:hypothetical protein
MLCVAYDRDGTRDERCGKLAWGRAAVELTAKQCPRWVLPRAPHETTLSVAQLEAIRDFGWASLTDAERMSVIGHVLSKDPTKGRLRLSFITRAAKSADDMLIGWATDYLVTIDRQIPSAWRAQYDKWISKVFGHRARAVAVDRDPDPQKWEAMYSLLSLVLAARDHDLVQAVIARLPELDKLHGPARVLVLRAAIINKASVAEDLIAELPKASSHRMADIAFALDAAPNLLDLMQTHVAEIKLLQPYQKQRLFGQLCDETRRADVEQLGRDIFPKPDPAMLRDYEWCIQERKAIEPELRAFFAEPPKRSQLRR